MKNYTITTREKLREACNYFDWFTCGSNEQYEKMFYANENGCTMEEIATIIWLCSDKKWCRRDIFSILKFEKEKFLKAIHSDN